MLTFSAARTAALSFALALITAPVSAQELVERYRAVIADIDRVNSSGARLTRPDQVLAQDRANLHRFGRGQPGDGVDRTFATQEGRARLPGLLAAGGLGPGVEAVLLGAGEGTLVVEVLGRSGQAEALRVSLEGSPAPATPAIAGGQERWSLSRDGKTISIDAIGTSGLVAALRCHSGGGGGSHVALAAAPGTATLLVAPNLLPLAASPSVSIGVDGVEHLVVRMTLAAPEGAWAAQVLLASPLLDALQSGRTLEFSAAGTSARVALGGSSSAITALRDACAAVAPGGAPTPSFECARAGTPTERALCASPALAALDARLNAAMARAEPHGGAALRDSQRLWLAARDRCGTDEACLSRTVAERVDALEAVVRGEFTFAQAENAAQSAPAAARTGGGVPGFGITDAGDSVLGLGANSTLEGGGAMDADADVAVAPEPAMGAMAFDGLPPLQQAVALWVIGQRPNTAMQRLPTTIRMWIGADLPPGYPAISQAEVVDRDVVERFIAALAARAGAEPPPEGGLALEQGVYLPDIRGGQTQLSLPSEMNIGLPRTAVPALRTLNLAVPLLDRRARMELVARRAFPLPMPEGLQERVVPGAAVTLRIEGQVDDMRVTMPVDDWSFSGEPVAKGSLEIRAVSLMQNGVALHRWTAPVGAAEFATFDVETVEGLAALYGGLPDDGRLLVTRGDMIDRLGIRERGAHLARGGDLTSLGQTADFAMRLAALVRAAPDRQLSENLVREVAMRLLTPLERAEILPPEFETGTMNEILAARLLDELEPRMRKLVLDRAPRGATGSALPLRALTQVILGEYDRRTGGFQIQPVNMQTFAWLPFAGSSEGMRGVVGGLPTTLLMDEEAAIAFLEKRDSDRRVIAQLDYDVTPRPIEATRGGSVRAEELTLAHLTHRPVALAFFAGLDRHQALMTVPFDAPESLGGPARPREVTLTTGATLRARASTLPGGEGMLEEALSYRRDLQRLPEPSRAAEIAALMAEIEARAPERFWIGARFQLAAWDAASGGFPIRRVEIRPVAHDADIDGLEPPGLRPADDEDFTVLPANHDDLRVLTEMLSGSDTVEGVFEVMLAGIDERGTIEMARPTRLWLGPQGESNEAILIAWPEREVLSVAGGTSVLAVPAPLRLTPETADLLLVSLEPELLDEAMLHRMLRERLAVERQAAARNEAPPWGAFFSDPSLRLDVAAQDALTPEFEAWTRARASALPDRMVLPMAENSRAHPLTGCSGLFGLRPAEIGYAVSAEAAALVGEGVAAGPAGAFSSAQTPLPGPDGAFALIGRPSHDRPGGGAACPSLAVSSGSETGAAPYADLAVVARNLPAFGPLPDRFAAADVTLEALSARFVPVERRERDGPGMRGVVVLEGQVAGVEIWTATSFRAEAHRSVTLAREDWQAARGTGPKSHDIVGLTLEADLASFTEAVRGRLPYSVRFEAGVEPGATLSPFARGVALVDPETREGFIAIPAGGAADAPVLSLARTLHLPLGAVRFEELRAQLEAKYGPAQAEGDENRQQLYWGLPSPELDPWQVCGGARKFTRGGPPTFLASEGNEVAPNDQRLGPYWFEYLGWPQHDESERAAAGLDHCGPVVMADMRRTDDRLILTVWLHDEGRARSLHERVATDEAVAAPPPPKPEL